MESEPSEEKRLQLCFEAVLKNLSVVESLGYHGEEKRKEVESLLDDLWKLTSQANEFYRRKYQVGHGWYMSEERQQLGRKILDMVNQGISGKEICKQLKIKPMTFYNLQTEYRIYKAHHEGQE
jgi:hypothetical protein